MRGYRWSGGGELSESAPHDRHGRNNSQRREPEAEQRCEAKRKDGGDTAPGDEKAGARPPEHERGERRYAERNPRFRWQRKTHRPEAHYDEFRLHLSDTQIGSCVAPSLQSYWA